MKKILAGILMVIMMMTVVTVFAETAVETATDPILDLYPGVELGMSPDEIYAKFGEDQFDKYEFHTDTIEIPMENGETATAKVSDLYLRAVREYHGKPVTVVFEIDDNKLIMFGLALIDKDLALEIVEEMEKVYGKVEISNELPLLDLVNIMSGNMPTYDWKTDTMRVNVLITDTYQEISYTPIQ